MVHIISIFRVFVNQSNFIFLVYIFSNLQLPVLKTEMGIILEEVMLMCKIAEQG